MQFPSSSCKPEPSKRLFKGPKTSLPRVFLSAREQGILRLLASVCPKKTLLLTLSLFAHLLSLENVADSPFCPYVLAFCFKLFYHDSWKEEYYRHILNGHSLLIFTQTIRIIESRR